jgi:hypothetical protein
MAKSPSPDNPYSAGSVVEAGWRLATFRDQRWSTTRDQEPPFGAARACFSVIAGVVQSWDYELQAGVDDGGAG